MTGKQHLVIGIGVSCVTMNLVCAGGILLGSIFPDIDSRESIISTFLPIQKITGCAFMKHRGGIHSLLSSFIFGIVALGLSRNIQFTIGFVVGYLLHLLADMLTYRGVPILYPKRKRYKLFPISFKDRECEGIACLILLSGFYLLSLRLGWL